MARTKLRIVYHQPEITSLRRGIIPVLGLRNGQTLADFEAEAMPHLNDLFRTAARLLLDHGEAHDAVQEVYLVAWKTFDRYQRATNCRAWLFRILLNVVLHERRKRLKWLTCAIADSS